MTKEEILSNKGEAWEYTNRLVATPVVSAYAAMDLVGHRYYNFCY